MKAFCVLKFNNIARFYLEDGTVFRTINAHEMNAGLRQGDTGKIYTTIDRGKPKTKFWIDAEEADYIFHKYPSKALTIIDGQGSIKS